MNPPVTVDYLVVGAGPVGLTTALLLAKQGRSCLVVERREGPQRHPAAHVVNARTLEVFRQLGLDMQAITAIAKDPADAGHVNFVTRLNGELIGRLPFERQGPECLLDTPTPLRNISQHRLEPLLAQAVDRAPTADLRYRCEWRSSSENEDGVVSLVKELAAEAEIQVQSKYVLAADGAGSRVRKSLGIEMIGPANLRSRIAIHIGGNLRPLIADRLGVLHFVMDPAAAGTFIAHDVDREWVFMTTFDPQEESVADYPPERCVDIVRDAAGTDVDIEILGVDSWHMSAQVASAMRDGRIFLVGDSAHRFPPTGGLGLNTGVADAHNLCWKLGAVDDGWASAELLDTYEIERKPIAEVNCEQSTTNAFKMVTLADALDLRGSSTTERMLTSLHDPEQETAIAAAVADQATHFDMIGLQLGYVYAEGAVSRTGEPPPPISNPSVFEPRGEVGARLPHAWTDDDRSTLDLVASDGFTLISFGDHQRWRELADAIATPITVVAVGHDVSVTDDWRQRCGLGASGVMLVRPDQHIAWRSDTIDHDSDSSLGAALTTIVGS